MTPIPEAHEIKLNGKLLVDENGQNLTTPLRDIRLPPGTYQMTFSNFAYGKTKTENFKVNPGQDLTINSILIQKQFAK